MVASLFGLLIKNRRRGIISSNDVDALLHIPATQALRVLPGSGLVTLSSGRMRDNPLRLLSLSTAQKMFDLLSNQFDLIIIDAPPVVVGGDCWMLARHVDRSVLVMKWGSTSESEIAMALNLLSTPSHDGGLPPKPSAGIVLNMMDRSKSRKLDTADSVMFAPSVFRYYHQRS